MLTKNWQESKTIIANLLSLLAVMGGAFGYNLGLTPAIQTEIVVGILALHGGIMAVFNILRRLSTDKGIAKTEKAPKNA